MMWCILYCLQLPEYFVLKKVMSVVDEKKIRKKEKVEMDRDILLPHSGSNEVFTYMSENANLFFNNFILSEYGGERN